MTRYMLSICIPTYNYNSSALIEGIWRQIQKEQEKVQLLVMDDASEHSFRILYKKLSEGIDFIQLDKNIGRSKIRNELAKVEKGDYLVFIDGDSSLLNDSFVGNYLNYLKKPDKAVVCCGGSLYSDEDPGEAYQLRWKYSKTREFKSKALIKKNPYKSFTTNNFLIKKDVFLSIKFDERIAAYGHEDTLFGFRLKQAGVSINYIDNQLLNGDLDTNEEFLIKTEQSIGNLLQILEFIAYDQAFIKQVPLLRVYFQLKVLGLEIFLRIGFKLFRKSLEARFLKGQVNLLLFDFYRLGVLSVLYRKK